MKKTLMVAILGLGLLVGVTGCAGFRAGMGAIRTTVNSGFDIVDKAADTAEKTFNSAVGGTKETVATATTSPAVTPVVVP